jgi:hypothetical protein
MAGKPLIPVGLCYSIRQALNVELPWDELALLATHGDFRKMSTLMSMRANAGLAERIALELPAGDSSNG